MSGDNDKAKGTHAITGATVLVVDPALLRMIDEAARKRGWSKADVLEAALDALEQQGIVAPEVD